MTGLKSPVSPERTQSWNTYVRCVPVKVRKKTGTVRFLIVFFDLSEKFQALPEVLRYVRRMSLVSSPSLSESHHSLSGSVFLSGCVPVYLHRSLCLVLSD